MYRSADLIVTNSQELMARIEDIASNEEKLKEANAELSHQMAQMVRESDEDKRQALQVWVVEQVDAATSLQWKHEHIP